MREIPLTKGMVAIVDDEDFEELSKFKWRFRMEGRCGRAVRTIQLDGTNDKINRRLQYMHRQIMNAGVGQVIDHKNCDGLDNRKENLRFCTIAENNRNSRTPIVKNKTSKYKGVSYVGAGTRIKRTRGLFWEARIGIEGKIIRLGRFATEIEAHRAYSEAAKKYFGEFARTG